MTANAKSFEERAASEPTDLHKAFAEWLFIQTGIKPDLKTVQLTCAFRMDFQKSEENQKDLKARKAAALAKKQKAAADKRARLEKQLAALQAELAKEDTAQTAASMPAETAAPTAPAAPAEPEKPAKATPARRTRRTAAAAK
ncbi:hypothetical protein ABTX80_13740 [Streptomyces erythrochromogenes]|uniref:hypothetical protein n=1 Tax=Streptomyces erythrochromogenes TaxID=285574 RepID=UPI003323486A